MNLEVSSLLKDVKDPVTVAEFTLLDAAITRLYINGYIPRRQMAKCREKLVREIQKRVGK